jgi:hypothetical protein
VSRPTPDVSPEELGRLARKYSTLAVLRAQRDGTDTTATRQTLRALSQDFPGCLRELDILGEAELRRRAEVTRAAAAGGPREPWMAWILSFHWRLAEALAKKRLAPARTAGGRLAPLILAEVAAEFGVPVTTVTDTLMPSRRRR